MVAVVVRAKTLVGAVEVAEEVREPVVALLAVETADQE
jgi:hypothetical protein